MAVGNPVSMFNHTDMRNDLWPLPKTVDLCQVQFWPVQGTGWNFLFLPPAESIPAVIRAGSGDVPRGERGHVCALWITCFCDLCRCVARLHHSQFEFTEYFHYRLAHVFVVFLVVASYLFIHTAAKITLNQEGRLFVTIIMERLQGDTQQCFPNVFVSTLLVVRAVHDYMG